MYVWMSGHMQLKKESKKWVLWQHVEKRKSKKKWRSHLLIAVVGFNRTLTLEKVKRIIFSSD